MQKACFFLAFFALKFGSHHGRSVFPAAVFCFQGSFPGLGSPEFRSVCLSALRTGIGHPNECINVFFTLFGWILSLLHGIIQPSGIFFSA